MKTTICVATIALTLQLTSATFSQSKDPRIIEDSLYSNVLKEQRKFSVALVPENNTQPKQPYKVIYCLDGIPDFVLSSTDFLKGEGFIPRNTILIGIQNFQRDGINMRERDFSPTKTHAYTGGADSFLLFMKNELMSSMQQQFHTAASAAKHL